MASIDRVVTVSITRNTQTIKRKAFGWALVIGSHALSADRVRWYEQATWSADLIADGHIATSEIYKAVANYFGQSPCPTKVAIGRIAPAEDADTALTACLAADPDWYGICLCSRVLVQQQKAMIWAEANERLFVTASYDATIVDQTVSVDTTSLAAIAKAAGYKRTGVLFTRGGSAAGSCYPEAAWLGRCLPKDPGAINWAHKTLSGITVDPLNSTESNNAHAKYCSTYEQIGGVNVTEEGWTGYGDFLDVTQACDWIKAAIQEEIWFHLANIDKIPYTDAGIKSVEGDVRRILQRGEDLGVLAPFDPDEGDYISSPKASEVSAADRAARTLNNVKFQRRLAGALNHIAIQGTVTV
jgi:hypothetical protein